MNSLFSVTNKRVLLTGGSRGIGAAVSKGLVDLGAKVGVFDRNPLILPISDLRFYCVDISNSVEVGRSFNSFLEEFGGIDALINIAGVTYPSPSEDYDKKDWDKTIETNLFGAFNLCQLAGRTMIKQKIEGSIVNFTSINAEQGFPNNPAYLASKGGLKQLSKGLAYDWGKHGIRVNNIGPGYTHTLLNEKSWNDLNLREQRSSHTFLGRWAEPEDFVGPVAFLISDASRYITGIDLYVDGGWTAKGL